MNSYYLFSIPAEIRVFAVIDNGDFKYVAETYVNGIFFNDDIIREEEMETLLKGRGNKLDINRLLDFTEEIVRETERLLIDLGEDEHLRVISKVESLLFHLFDLREEIEI